MHAPCFPAIAVSHGDSFHVVQSAPDGVSAQALRSGYLERLYLFDSHGERWRVARVERTSKRPNGPFGALVGVRLSFAPPDRPPLSEIAEALCHLVDAEPDGPYEQLITREALKVLFRSAPTASALIAAASNRGAESR